MDEQRNYPNSVDASAQNAYLVAPRNGQPARARRDARLAITSIESQTGGYAVRAIFRADGCVLPFHLLIDARIPGELSLAGVRYRCEYISSAGVPAGAAGPANAGDNERAPDAHDDPDAAGKFDADPDSVADPDAHIEYDAVADAFAVVDVDGLAVGYAGSACRRAGRAIEAAIS